MKNRKILRILVFSFGFFAGILFFFPLNHFKGQVLGLIQSTTGVSMSSKNISMGTGLGLGLARGGLFAFHLEDFQAVTASGQKIQCKEASLSPHLWTFFIGRLQVGLRCIDKKEGQILAKLEASPFWSPTSADVFVTLDDLNLGLLNSLFPGSGNYNGKMNGTLSATRINLARPEALPRVEWELEGSDVSFPAVSSPLISLPAIKLGPLKTRGSLKIPRLNVEQMEFGNDMTSLKGNWIMTFDLNSNFLPSKGEWKGSLKADSEIERMGIGGYKLEQLFGPLKSNGGHEFKKTLREGESILSLLSSAPATPAEN